MRLNNGGKMKCEKCGKEMEQVDTKNTGDIYYCKGCDIDYLVSGNVIVELNKGMKMEILVCEDHNENGIDWGISFLGNNPPKDKYIKCENASEAFKLKNLIEEKLKKLQHFKDTTIELWATDRPDLLTKEEKQKCHLFQIKP